MSEKKVEERATQVEHAENFIYVQFKIADLDFDNEVKFAIQDVGSINADYLSFILDEIKAALIETAREKGVLGDKNAANS